MKNKDVIILGKILAYYDEILETCRYFGNNLDEFVNNHIFLNACCMCILQIGELCKNISYDIREKESDVEWKAWCGIRDVFAHQYANIDYKITWDTIQEDVPLLKAKIEEILDKV